MAGSKSLYLENAMLNHILGGVIWTPPSVIYVALSQALYDEAATTAFGEITTGGMSRVAVANNLTNWPSSGTSSVKYNGVTITFPAALTTLPEARAFYLLDALSAGNILYGGDLTQPRILQAGDTASFGPGSLQIQED